jgi:hypothetical protein
MSVEHSKDWKLKISKSRRMAGLRQAIPPTDGKRFYRLWPETPEMFTWLSAGEISFLSVSGLFMERQLQSTRN